jgi:hypothetical protein
MSLIPRSINDPILKWFVTISSQHFHFSGEKGVELTSYIILHNSNPPKTPRRRDGLIDKFRRIILGTHCKLEIVRPSFRIFPARGFNIDVDSSRNTVFDLGGNGMSPRKRGVVNYFYPRNLFSANEVRKLLSIPMTLDAPARKAKMSNRPQPPDCDYVVLVYGRVLDRVVFCLF